MRKLFYSIIYQHNLNFVLRNINRLVYRVLPSIPKIYPTGKLQVEIGENENISLRTNQTSHITYKLFWEGSDNYEYTPIFKSLITKISTFLDIGASIGYYSLLASKNNSSLQVESFEPSTGPAIFFAQNIIDNQLETHINLHILALSNKTGYVEFNEVQNRKFPHLYNLSGEHNLNTKIGLFAKKIKVESNTLDKFLDSNPQKTIDLIKIDVEGAECTVIEGGLETIKKHQPIIICETLFNKIEAALESLMKPLGYEFYNQISNNKLQKVETIKRDRDNGVRNCFFVHPSKVKLIEEYLV